MGRRGDLDGRVLFIARVGPPTGAVTARVAAQEGAKAALAARGNEVPAQVAAEIRSQVGRALGLKCDLTDAAPLGAAVRATEDELGGIDCVFYNTGFYDNDHSSIEIDPDLWKLTMDVNEAASK